MRGAILLSSLLLPARLLADSSPPERAAAACYDATHRDCLPAISEDGQTVAYPRVEYPSPVGDGVPTVTVAFATIGSREPPVTIEPAQASTRLREGRFRRLSRVLPANDRGAVFAWGTRAKAALASDAFGLTFRVAELHLKVARGDRRLADLALTRPGGACYQLSPYVVTVWLDLKEQVVAVETYGDKCLSPKTDWTLARLLPF